MAAAAALTYAEKGGSNSEVQERLKKSARDIYRSGVDRATGHGILDMTRLIDADIPVEVIDMGPKRKTLKQKEVEFDFKFNEGAEDNLNKKYDIVGPGESTNYKSISSKSFEEDLSKYNGGDDISVKVKVTDSNGYTDIRKRGYNIYENKTPPVEIREFNSVGRLFLGTEGSGNIVVENTEPVINHFEAKVVRKDSGSVIDSISKTFKPGEIDRFGFSFKPNKVGSQTYRLTSPTHNLSKDTETSVSVNSPVKIDMNVDRNKIMKGEKVDITINFEQKRSSIISNLDGAFYFEGEKKRDISVGVGAFGETIKKEYKMEEEGEYTAILELKRHLSKNITRRVTVDCVSRRNVSRGQSKYECSHGLSRDISVDNRTRRAK